MYFIINIQYALILHVVKQLVEKNSTLQKYIIPELFDSLVVDTPSSNEATSTWSSEEMLKHERFNTHIFTTSIRTYSTWHSSGSYLVNNQL